MANIETNLTHHKDESVTDIPVDIPRCYSISSSGMAAVNHPKAMGIYILENQNGYNNTPIYKRPYLEKYLYLAETGNWMISSKSAGTSAFLFQESGSSALPLDHVEWFSASSNQDIGFEIDRTLLVKAKEGT